MKYKFHFFCKDLAISIAHKCTVAQQHSQHKIQFTSTEDNTYVFKWTLRLAQEIADQSWP